MAKLPWRLRRAGVTPERIAHWRSFINDLDDPRHGTQNGYSNLFCRCDRCRAANVRTTSAARERRSKAIPADRHGRLTTYFNYSCRCSFCKEANRLNRNIDPATYPRDR